MNSYTFAITPVVYAGPGSIQQLQGLMDQMAVRHPIIMTDRVLYDTGIASRVEKVVSGSVVYKDIKPDPSTDEIFNAVKFLKSSKADVVIAVGGGSVIDVAKLSAMLMTNTKSLREYTDNWELIQNPGIPLITIPTTVGSGSEMTRGAVFVDSETHMKKVIVSTLLAAQFCVLDPELLNTLPKSVTAATGADALTQAIEGVVSTNRTPFTDSLHLHAIRLIRDALRPAVNDSADIKAMGTMQEAAAMVGAAMAYSGVGAVHAIANVLGGHYHIPHGVACAIMLLPVLKYNITYASPQYRSIGDALDLDTKGHSDEEVAHSVVNFVTTLLKDIGFDRRLSEFGVKVEDVSKIAKEARDHSDMVSNPHQPSLTDVENLLNQAI